MNKDTQEALKRLEQELLAQEKPTHVSDEDLDVLMELCDRIMVINSGRVTGIVDGRTARKDEIGLLMTKSKEEMQDGEN